MMKNPHSRLDASPGAEPAPTRAPLDPQRVMDALRTVIDPEVGLDIVSLGLIYVVEVTAEDVTVRYTLTTPGCPLAEYIGRSMRHAVQPLIDGRELRMRLVFEPRWGPERISMEAV
jgi:metal-sulfur cluster biosynthetic enzyme